MRGRIGRPYGVTVHGGIGKTRNTFGLGDCLSRDTVECVLEINRDRRQGLQRLTNKGLRLFEGDHRTNSDRRRHHRIAATVFEGALTRKSYRRGSRLLEGPSSRSPLRRVRHYNLTVDHFGAPDGVPANDNAAVRPGPSPSGKYTLARGRVEMAPATASKIAENSIVKGDVLATARVAGIMAARQASLLIPSGNPPFVERVQVHFTIEESHVDVEAHVDAADRTGVGLEVLSAVTVAALTIYDMCKSADRTMVINEIALWDAVNADETEWHRAGASELRRDTGSAAKGEDA